MKPGTHCHTRAWAAGLVVVDPQTGERPAPVADRGPCEDPAHRGLGELLFTFVTVGGHWYLALPPQPA